MRIRSGLGIILTILVGLPSSARAVDPPRERIAPSPEYIFTLELKDNSGALVDARVSVLDPGSGLCFPPTDPGVPVYDSWSGHSFFYATGRVDVRVPEGTVRVLVSRGPEYTYHDALVTVIRDGTQTVQLRRLVDATRYGWFSGDTHVHIAHGGAGAAYRIDNEAMAQVARAEDLNVTCVLSNGRYFNGKGIDPAGDDRHLIHYAMEYRSAIYGHMGILGLDHLLPVGCCYPGYPAYPLNRAVCNDAHAQGATVVFAHPVPMDPLQFMNASLPWPYSGFGREVPAVVVADAIDAIDVFSYSNYSDEAARQLWFDLLNLGHRLPLSVGTDASVNRTYDPPAGGFRLYVQPKAPFSLDSWLSGLRAGRSFATNGPFIFDFNLDGKGLGESLVLPANGVHVAKAQILLYSREPLDKLEIFMNGRSVLSVKLPDTVGWFTYDFTMDLNPAPGWVVARVSGKAYAPTTVGTREQAITSPIYLELPGEHFEPTTAAVQRFDGWIRDLQALVLTRAGWQNSSQMMSVWNELEASRRRLPGRPTILEDPRPVPELPVAPDGITVRLSQQGSSYRFAAEGPGEGALEVFDVAGRLVRASEPQPLPGVFTWNGRGAAGPVPAGLYFARIRGTAAQSPVQRVLVVR